MYDALDTMWLMGLRDEFEHAMKYISVASFHQENVRCTLLRNSNGFTNPMQSQSAMFFETVIRYLGGLLAAYTLSGRDELLRKADELGGKLMPIFNTPTGMPAYGVNTVTYWEALSLLAPFSDIFYLSSGDLLILEHALLER